MNNLANELVRTRRARLNPLFAFFVLVIFGYLAYLTGVRDAATGTDTEVYGAIYAQIQSCGCLVESVEPLFGVLALIIGYFDFPASVFFGVVAGVQFSLIFYLCVAVRRFAYKDAKGDVFQLLAFSLVLASPFFLNAQVNVIRQGLGAPLTLLAAIYFLQRRNWAALFFAIAALGMHYSSALFFIFFPFLRAPRRRIYTLMAVLVFAYSLGLTEGGVKILSDLFGLPIYGFFQNYGADTEYRRGVRYDFLIFSLCPIFLIWLMRMTFRSLDFARRIEGLESIYLLFLGPFLLVGWGGFSDRYLLNAWLFLPIVVAIVVARFVPVKSTIYLFGMIMTSALIYASSLGRV